MKYFITSLVFTVFFLLSFSTVHADQKIVELKKCDCSSDVENTNKAVLENAIQSNVILLLPEGNFSSEALALSGVENLTIRGTVDPVTNEVKTRLKIMKPMGISVSYSSNVRFENLEIEGLSDSQLVKISSAGDLKAENMFLKTGTTGVYSECLRPNLDWLVPVISLILN